MRHTLLVTPSVRSVTHKIDVAPKISDDPEERTGRFSPRYSNVMQ